MVRFAVAATFALATSAVALPQIGGGNNNDNNAGVGSQFITGECASDGDCASGCCAANTGLCAARAVAEEGAGCGFGGDGNGADADVDEEDNVVVDDENNADNDNADTGDQFITGECAADADCASGCCAADTGLCAARAVAEEGAGCGFGGADAADDADDDADVGMVMDDEANDAVDDDDDEQDDDEQNDNEDNDVGQGEQFITGECGSDADCASGCCAAGTGLCAARAVAEEGAGCGFGGDLAGGNNATETSDVDIITATEEAIPVETEDIDDVEEDEDEDGVDDDADVEDDDGAENVGSGDGSQFITGACIQDADCASGCCADLNGSGVCSAELVQFEDGKNGCGFVDSAAA